MNDVELKRCPFCGDTATMYMEDYIDRHGDKEYDIACNNPGCIMSFGTNIAADTPEDAARFWNKRAGDE